MCDTNADPFRYDLTLGKWIGNAPKFTIYEDQLEEIQQKQEQKDSKAKKREGKLKEIKAEIISIPSNASSNKYSTTQEGVDSLCQIGEVPLLTRNKAQYDAFLAYHDNKVVVLVDVPNFIRTLFSLYPRDFETVLRKAHDILLQFVENSFSTAENYVIRYYSNPDKDLQPWNSLLMEFCRNNLKCEFFHLLEIEKRGHYGDIDNYLIANGVELLERCSLRGIVIVSSDKDYLPVMRIASHKNVRKYIYGINTTDIYEKYGISDIKLMGTLDFFKK